MYRLGILLYLHPYSTAIAPIFSTSCGQYHISNEVVTINFMKNDDKSNIIYLNKIDRSTCGDDGFIESKPAGPDIVFHIDSNISSTLKEKYLQLCKSQTKWYSMQQPTCYKSFTNHPFKSSKIIKLRYARVIDSTDMPSIPVSSKPITTTPGYAFAYPSNSPNIPSYVSFAFLSEKDAKKLIRMKRIRKEEYRILLDELATHKENYRCYEVGDKGLSLDECTYSLNERQAREYFNNVNDMKPNKVHLRARSRIHSLWKKCLTFNSTHLSTMKKIISRTYGNFGVSRSCTKCFGINVYVGKNAEYVRPTPKMCQSSISVSEYYR